MCMKTEKELVNAEFALCQFLKSINELPKSSRELKTVVFLREKGHLLKQASTPSQGQHYHSPQGAQDGQPTCLLGDSRKVQRHDWMSPM